MIELPFHIASGDGRDARVRYGGATARKGVESELVSS